MSKQSGFTLVEGLLIVLILSVIGFAGYFIWNQQSEDNGSSESMTSIPENPEPKDVAEEAEVVLDETEYYELIVPEGFERVDDRIFTFTGQPEETFSYLNSSTGDYFEVNINQADSGLNADFVWTYAYVDGVFTLDRSDSTVCLPEDDDWCTFSGANDRLDAAIFAQPETSISGQRIYFTFGNTASQTVGDLSYVDQFLENITF